MRPIEGKQAQDIPLALKEHHDGILCDKHYLQLSKSLKKRKIEEVSHVVEPAQMEERSPEPLSGAEEVPESQEEHTTTLSTSTTTLAVSREQAIRRGPKLKYSSDERFKFAAGAALGVSLNKVGQLYQLYRSPDFSKASLANSPSRSFSVQCLMELHTCFRYHLAETLSQSSNISLMMDSTTVMTTSRTLPPMSLTWNMPDMIHKGDGATPQHVSSFAIIRVMGRIRSQLFHRPFKAFVRANGGSPPRIPVYSEIRYGMLDQLCLTFCQHQGFILLFLFQCRPLLTESG